RASARPATHRRCLKHFQQKCEAVLRRKMRQTKSISNKARGGFEQENAAKQKSSWFDAEFGTLRGNDFDARASRKVRPADAPRSEERRVGKDSRSRRSAKER